VATTFNPAVAGDAPYLERPTCDDLKHIPGSDGLPFVGNLFEVIKDINGFQQRQIARYGQLSRINMGLAKGILVTHPDHLRQVFTDPDESFSSAMGYEGPVSTLYGGSIITQDFAHHKASRRVFQTAFKRPALEGYVEVMNPTIRENIEHWGAQGDIRYVDAARKILIDVGARVFFGTRPDGEQLRYIAHLFHEMNYVGLMALAHRNIPGSRYWRGQRAKRKMEALILDVIQQRRADPGNDLTSILAAERDDPERAVAARQRVEHRAERLARRGLGDDRPGVTEREGPGHQRAVTLALGEPERPRPVQIGVPGVERPAHVLGHPVERPSERMVREIDLAALQHPTEQRVNALDERFLGQRAAPERAHGRVDVGAHAELIGGGHAESVRAVARPGDRSGDGSGLSGRRSPGGRR